MNFKINFSLLMKLLLLEIIYFYAMYFLVLFSLFGYFGSGAGASSEKAILAGKIGTYIIILPPILYNVFKMFSHKNSEKTAEFNSNLIAGILITLFISYHYYIGFLSS